MALSPKTIPFVFLLTFFFMQIYARDSQFFSKVSPSTTNNGKEEEKLNKQEQDPTFMPETQNGYGLYGQESSQTQFPTTTTTTKLGNAPYTTSSTAYKTQNQETYANYPNTNYPNTNTNDNYNNNNEYSNSNQFYSNNNAYDQKQQHNFGETSLEESNSNNKYINYNGYSNSERQGMSDTRFLENGKFYYDVKSENNYYPNHYQNSRTNNYDTNNNDNTYQYNNSMENFQDDQYVP